MFYSWMPRSGLEPTQGPAMEGFRSDPTSHENWLELELDCCVPVRSLRAR
jgi:hypothetical protein